MATLPNFQSDNQVFQLMQGKWAAILNPLLRNPVNSGMILENIVLASGDNVINHLLGKKLQGYIVVNMKNAYADIYSKTSSTPNLTLILNASGATTVDLYVF